MGSTFLTLTNKVLQKINEVPLTSSTFSGRQGVFKLAQDSINEALQTINQKAFEWPFNKASGSQTLTAGVQLYSLPSGFKTIDWDTFYLQKDTNLEVEGRPLQFISFDEWHTRYRSSDEDILDEINNQGNTGTFIPTFVFESPDQEFGVSVPPNAAYTISFDYWAIPSDLVNHDDEATVPSHFDNVIVQGAMQTIHRMRDNEESARAANARFTESLNNMARLLLKEDDRIYDRRVNRRG